MKNRSISAPLPGNVKVRSCVIKVLLTVSLLFVIGTPTLFAQSYPWTVECKGELSYKAEDGEVITSGSISVDYRNIYPGEKYIIAIADMYFKGGNKKRKFVQINRENGKVERIADAENSYAFGISSDAAALYIPIYDNTGKNAAKPILKVVKVDRNTLAFSDIFSSEGIPELSFIAEGKGKVKTAGVSPTYKLLVLNYEDGNDNNGYVVRYDLKTVQAYENRKVYWYFNDSLEIYNYKKSKVAGIITCATMKVNDVDNSSYAGHPYTSDAPRSGNLGQYYLEFDNIANSGIGAKIAVTQLNAKIMEMYVPYDIELAFIDTPRKMVYYYKSTNREVSLSGFASERKILSNDYINIIRKLQAATDEETRIALKHDSMVVMNKIYNTYAKSYDYDKPRVYMDEAGVLCFPEKAYQTTEVSEYLNYAVNLPSKVEPADFANKFHEYEKRASRDMIKQMKTIAVNRPMSVITKATHRNYALGGFVGSDKNTVYAFWSNVFYKIDNKDKKVIAYRPTEAAIKEVGYISTDTYLVVSSAMYQIVDMRNGLVVSETRLPKHYIGLGQTEFQHDGELGKLYCHSSKCFMYFNIRTLEPVAYFDESYDEAMGGWVRKRALKGVDTFYFSCSSDYPKGKSMYLNTDWTLKYNGDFESREIGDSTYTYKAMNATKDGVDMIVNFASSQRVEGFGFYNSNNNHFEMFEGRVADIVPQQLTGAWSADIDNNTFLTQPPVYPVSSVYATRTRWPKPKEEVAKKVEEKAGPKVCTFCDGNPRRASKRCQNNCNNGKVYETTRADTYIGGGVNRFAKVKKEYNCRECGGTGTWVCRHCKGTGLDLQE